MMRLLLLSFVVACGGPTPYPVTRVIDGEEQEGVYVSPYAYEAFLEGELFYNRAQYDEAFEAYARARTGPRDDRFVVSRMVQCRLAQEEFEAAETLYQEAIAMSDGEGGPPSEALFLAGAEAAFHLENPVGFRARLLEAHKLSRDPSHAASWACDVALSAENGSTIDPALSSSARASLSDMTRSQPSSLHARLEHAVLVRDDESLRSALESMSSALLVSLRDRRFELAERTLFSAPEIALRLARTLETARALELEVRALVELERLDEANAQIARSLAGHEERTQLFALVGSDELAYSEGQSALPSDNPTFLLTLAQVASRLGHHHQALELLGQITTQDAEFEAAETLRQNLARELPL